MRDERSKAGERAASLCGEDLFERRALRVVCPFVNIRAQRPFSLGHDTGGIDHGYRVEAREIGAAVPARIDMEGDDHIAMALGRFRAFDQQAGAEKFAVAGFEILAVQLPVFIHDFSIRLRENPFAAPNIIARRQAISSQIRRDPCQSW